MTADATNNVDPQQLNALTNHVPRGWRLKRKIKDGLEGWHLSAFPLTTCEVEEIFERLNTKREPRYGSHDDR
jgi:hypothetical protein